MRSLILIWTVLLVASIGATTRAAQTHDEQVGVWETPLRTEHLPSLWYEENSTHYLRDTGLYDVETHGMLKSPDDVLDHIAELLRKNPSILTLQVRAHADLLEREPDSLAMQRARTTCTDLMRRGIATDRLIPVSMGVTNPVIAEQIITKLSTREEQLAARICNRTVSFYITTTSKQ
ncbi:MAG: hypothetical protein IT229_01975 [Flavobacteriales bacterium]|nr:hypothetical protein [Flavobacteriales bacterium]